MKSWMFGLALLVCGPAAAEPVAIAMLGDSLTQGYGLAPAEGLVPKLEAWLRERGADVRLVNAGVSGDTTAGGLSRLDWTLTPDVDGLIVALGGNDLLRGLDPSVSRANLDGILDGAKAAGVPAMLVGLAAPGNFGADYKAAFDAIFPDLGREHQVPLFPSILDPVIAAENPADLMQADGIHPNGRGVERIVGDLGPALLPFVDGLGGCPNGCR